MSLPPPGSGAGGRRPRTVEACRAAGRVPGRGARAAAVGCRVVVGMLFLSQKLEELEPLTPTRRVCNDLAF